MLEGVQHPAPELPCSVIAEPNGTIRVRAPYAAPYVGLRRVLPIPPNTEIWIVLYARVTQADASTKRNIQLALRRADRLATPRRPSDALPVQGEVSGRGPRLRMRFDRPVAGDSPISALAVEVLPEPNGGFGGPLGGDLGQVRILRTSPLAPVDRDCCTPTVRARGCVGSAAAETDAMNHLSRQGHSIGVSGARSIDAWLGARDVRVNITGEIDDAGTLRAFGI